MKKVLSYLLCLTAVITTLSGNAYATRMRQVQEQLKQGQIESGETENKIDYGSITYVDGLPGPGDFDWSKYLPEGSGATVPDFNLYTEFDADEITNFSDAIVDFLGWDAAIGTANYDLATNVFSFTPLEGATASTNYVTGYGKKKFGSGKYEFKAKLDANDGVYNGWLGISLLCENSQSMQWESNPGYLLCLKKDTIEVQKYFPTQEMLEIYPNNKITLGQWHEYCLEVNVGEEATEIALSIDGEELFRHIDAAAPRAPKEGYVNFYCAEDSMSFMPVNATITQENEGLGAVDTTGAAKLICFKEGVNTAYANGNAVPIDAENPAVFPLKENDRILVPLRFLGEQSGYKVSWDDETQTASVVYGGNVMEITPGFSEYRVNGITYKMDVSPKMYQNRLFVPARFVSEAFKKQVLWENDIVWITDGEEITPELRESVIDSLRQN